MKRFLIVLIITIQTLFCFGQTEDNKDRIINPEDFMKLRIEENTFSFGWLNSVFSGIPCMRDYRKMEVTIYDSLGNEERTPKPKSLNVFTEKILLDTLEKTITIKGYILDGWYGAGSDIQIYIGQRVDTIAKLTIASSSDIKVLRNGKRNTEPIVLNTYPAFYLKNYSRFKSEVGYTSHKERAFSLSSEINDRSILIFGLSDCYTEIFEIGRLLNKK